MTDSSYGVIHHKGKSTGSTYAKNITDRMKITKHLATFLAEEGILTQFIDNHVKQFGEDHNPIIYTVSHGFSWHNTPEGQEYWNELHFKHCTRNENN